MDDIINWWNSHPHHFSWDFFWGMVFGIVIGGWTMYESCQDWERRKRWIERLENNGPRG